MNYEIWKDIEGYEGLYQVSNKGRIKSVARVLQRKNGVKLPLPEKILSFTKSKPTKRHPKIRYSVQLWKENEKRLLSVHRVVAKAFIPNPKNKPQINHIDGDTTNNCIENLEWVTAQENVRHAFENGLIKPNLKALKSKALKAGEVIRGVHRETGGYAEFSSIHEAARALGVTVMSISNVVRHNSKCEYDKRACKGYEFEYVNKSVETTENIFNSKDRFLLNISE